MMRAMDVASLRGAQYADVRVTHATEEDISVKNGQVTDARVLNPRPGAKAYEALALKTARQRRYPKNFTGGDTWKVRVKP